MVRKVNLILWAGSAVMFPIPPLHICYTGGFVVASEYCYRIRNMAGKYHSKLLILPRGKLQRGYPQLWVLFLFRVDLLCLTPAWKEIVMAFSWKAFLGEGATCWTSAYHAVTGDLSRWKDCNANLSPMLSFSSWASQVCFLLLHGIMFWSGSHYSFLSV